MSKPDDMPEGCAVAAGIFSILFVISLVITGVQWCYNGTVSYYNDWQSTRAIEAHQTEVTKAYKSRETEERTKITELENRLATFCQEHVPELSAAFLENENAWKELGESCKKLEAELQLLGRSPESDADLQRWRMAIEEMEAHRTDLSEQRKEAYIAFKKFELAPSGKPDYEAKLAKAKEAAAKSRAYHKEMQTRVESK